MFLDHKSCNKLLDKALNYRTGNIRIAVALVAIVTVTMLFIF